jgi:hypothetical protein
MFELDVLHISSNLKFDVFVVEFLYKKRYPVFH